MSTRALDYRYFLELTDDADRWAYADACDWSKLETTTMTTTTTSSSPPPPMTGFGRLVWHCAVNSNNHDNDCDVEKDIGPVTRMLQRAHQAHNRRSTALSEPDGFGQRPVDLALFYQDGAAVRALRHLGARLDMHPLLRSDADWSRRRPALLARAVVVGVVAAAVG